MLSKLPKGIKSAIVISDVHCPHQDDGALRAVEEYMGSHHFDYYLNLGDFMDMDVLSNFTKGKPGLLEGRRLADDFEKGNEILTRHQELIRRNNKKAKFVLLEGNHCHRLAKWLEENPQLEGSIDIEDGLRLKKRGFEYVKCYSEGKHYSIGNMYFTHGMYTNQYHAAKTVARFGNCVMYGHTHTNQMHTQALLGRNKKLVGQGIGCLCKYKQRYIIKDITSWQLAFAVVYFRDNGYFNHYVVSIFDGQFVGPDGMIYGQ